MAERSYRWLFWVLALVGLALDQGTKYGVFGWLKRPDGVGEREVVPGAFRLVAHYAPRDGVLQPQVNHGALFGLGREYESLANGLFAVVSLIAAAAIVYWSTRPSSAGDVSLCAALGLILAGTLGNLYDRLVFNGVRDFLHFYWIDWPVFNLADCFLVIGAALLLMQAFWTRPVPVGAESPEPSMGREVA